MMFGQKKEQKKGEPLEFYSNIDIEMINNKKKSLVDC